MRFISATYVFDGKQFLNDNPVLVLDDNNCFVEYIRRKKIKHPEIEHYEGILCPGFVNAHCHLELSHMKGVILEKSGLLNFAKEIITKRRSFSKEDIQSAIVSADKFMWENGIVAVGDISNTVDSFDVKQKSPIFYHTFLELIGFDPEQAEYVFAMGKELQRGASRADLKNSLVPHAPYSVSEPLLEKISSDVRDTKYPLSIHNQEHADEDLFFKSKEGIFTELYEFLRMNISFFQAGKASSLQSYLPHLSPAKNLLLVHNTFTKKDDIVWAKRFHEDLYWCLCPNANLYIENIVPNLKNFMDENCKTVIGTDSLASNKSLSMVSEINALLKNFNWVRIADTLKWATYNGAESLGIEDKFGSFIKGKNTGINHLNYTPDKLIFGGKLA